MRFIKLEKDAGGLIFVNPDEIACLEKLEGQTIVCLTNGEKYYIKETVDVIKTLSAV